MSDTHSPSWLWIVVGGAERLARAHPAVAPGKWSGVDDAHGELVEARARRLGRTAIVPYEPGQLRTRAPASVPSDRRSSSRSLPVPRDIAELAAAG